MLIHSRPETGDTKMYENNPNKAGRFENVRPHGHTPVYAHFTEIPLAHVHAQSLEFTSTNSFLHQLIHFYIN